MVELWESDANNPKDDPEQPVIRSFLPVRRKNYNLADNRKLLTVDAQDPCVNKTRFDEKVEDSDMVAADAMEDGNLYGADIKEALQECPQIREEYSFAQNQITSMLKSLNDRQEHRLADFSNRSEVPPTGIQRKSPKQPQQTGQTVTPPHPFDANLRLLSHSATRVRRGLYEAQGRVRSMIDAINGKGDASQMISFVDNRSMVTSMVKTIHRGRKSENPASPEQPITPNKKNSSTKRRLQRLPYSDLQTLPKAAKLQVVAKHEFHRLAPIVEEPNPQFLVLAKYVANTVVLRRAKAIKVRNLNAFHCPVRQPRFGLKRKVLAPPVPRHSTPPVAVPCSKYVDLGRRRVSKMEWCFVV